MTFACFVCKKEAEGGYHVFMKARKAQEKDNFRDVCEGCMTTLLEATEGGYEVLAEPRIVASPDTQGVEVGMPRGELVAMFREAMNILPDKVRRGIYSPFWERCKELLDQEPKA